MTCYITCILAVSLLGGAISTMVYNFRQTRLEKTLHTHQKNIYHQIKRERQQKYWQGTLLGLVLGLIYFLHSNKFTKNQNICSSMVIALSTTYFYYTFQPQKDYLLLHLTNTAQVEAWLTDYLHMKKIYHIVFLLLGISYLLTTYGFTISQIKNIA